MRTAELPDLKGKNHREREATSSHLFEDNGAFHVLVVAALTAFVVFVLGEGLRFSDSQTLALIVFFVMSIAGVVLGGGENSAAKPGTRPATAAQPELTVPPAITAQPDACAPQPKASLAPAMETH